MFAVRDAHDVVAVDAQRFEPQPDDEQVPGDARGTARVEHRRRGEVAEPVAYQPATRVRAATNSSRRASCAIPSAACSRSCCIVAERDDLVVRIAVLPYRFHASRVMP
jgi:hypothetical protein